MKNSILLVACGFLFHQMAGAQLASSAYRGLGQPDLRKNGVNRVEGVELSAPNAIALDTRDGQLHLYVADTRNHRVLAWRDANNYQNGDPPELALGQPSPLHSNPLGIGEKGFNGPTGLAIDPGNGNLYVADLGNNRVLRFPAPFANPSRIEPDAVYGQSNFSGRTANPLGITKSSLKSPRSVAFDSNGNLWVADSGNHRILRFNAAALGAPNPEADLVLGQADFSGGAADRSGPVGASGFDTPYGLAFDEQNNLYVSDFLNTRVLRFAAPVVSGATAGTVFGEANFTVRGVPPQASNLTLQGPAGLAADRAGNLYVAVPLDNRVLVFSTSAASGSPAKDVLGQANFSSALPNAGAFPRAAPGTLSGAADIKVDPDGNVFIADTGNNRVIAVPAGSKSATRVWGQKDFAGNGPNQIKAGSINSPYKIVIDYSQSPFALYLSDINNHRILVWKDSARFRTGDPADLVIGQPDFGTALPNVDTQGAQKPSRTSLSSPKGIAVDANGNLYAADSDNNRVLRFPRPVDQSGRISADAVWGQADFTSSISAAVNASSLHAPSGVAIGPDGNLFVADSGNNRVLEFASGAGTPAAAIRVYGQPNFTSGSPAQGASAQNLSSPQGIAVDTSFNLYVADAGQNRVLIFSGTKDAPPTGVTATVVIGQVSFASSVAGSGSAGLRVPVDVAVDSSGNIYVSDLANNRVLTFPSLLFLPFSGGAAMAVTGQRDMFGVSPNWNSTDLLATPEGLSTPEGIYVDRRDTLYVGDAGNNRVLHFLKSAVVVNAAHLQASAPVARGAIVTLFGAGILSPADAGESAAGTPWPVSLASRNVVVSDDIVAPLFFVGPTQINFQLPLAVPSGTPRIAVRVADTWELLAGGSFPVAVSSPGFFTASQDGKGQGAILNQDQTVNSPTNAAARGTVVTLFGTGQGAVDPPVADGAAAPSAEPLARTVAAPTSDGAACLSKQPSVCVAIGSTFGDISYSGLAPGFVGLWQINVKIPANALTGPSIPVRAVINATPSNLISMAIR